MNHEAQLKALLAEDRVRMQVLRTVRGLDLPDCWVSAGFMRSLVDFIIGKGPCVAIPNCA
jgi:hypothetical protein